MAKYIKDFDKWYHIIKHIDEKNPVDDVLFREREIWWCSMGVNVGSEIDGKNDLFERPVLIIKKINKDLLLIAPLTSKIINDRFRIDLVHSNTKSQILIYQSRVISSKRLIRRIGYVKKSVYQSSIIEYMRLILLSK